jgi:hypothetical protein
MPAKIKVELTRAQASALRLAADYILYAGENPAAFGWDPRTARALQRADEALARATGTQP